MNYPFSRPHFIYGGQVHGPPTSTTPNFNGTYFGQPLHPNFLQPAECSSLSVVEQVPAPIQSDPVKKNIPEAIPVENKLSNHDNGIGYLQLKNWTPVSIEKGGTCHILGYTLDSGRLIYSEKIVFVGDCGSVVFDGKQFLKLRGPICFDTYKIMYPQLNNVSLPERIQSIFSSGLPRSGWHRGIKKLYRFLLSHLKSPNVRTLHFAFD